ncbi:MAG TPA: hypothetical protein VFX88_07110 [Actinomycetota bacterium]|jgi:trk system potassium uptake protein TrkA|nr:hypothetical protein [Actinomycetota bacterium]
MLPRSLRDTVRRQHLRHPAQTVAAAVAAGILAGTLLLSLPQLRTRYGITVVCIKPEGGSFTYATPDTAPGLNDVVVVAGETRRVEDFANLG